MHGSGGDSPQHGVLAVTPHTADLPCLVADLDVQNLGAEVALVGGVVVGVVGAADLTLHRVSLAGVGPKVQRGATAEPHLLVVGQPALGPWPHLQAVPVFPLAPGARAEVLTGSGLCEVRAAGSSVDGRGEDGPAAMLQADPAARTAGRPAGEVGHDAGPGAGDEAGLFLGRPAGEELAYALRHSAVVRGAHAAHAAPLHAMLRHHALGRPRPAGRQRAGAPL